MFSQSPRSSKFLFVLAKLSVLLLHWGDRCAVALRGTKIRGKLATNTSCLTGKLKERCTDCSPNSYTKPGGHFQTQAYFLMPGTAFSRHCQCLYMSRHPLGSNWGGLRGLGFWGGSGVKFLHIERKITSVVHSHPPSHYIRTHVLGWRLVMFTTPAARKTKLNAFASMLPHCAASPVGFSVFVVFVF